MAVSNAYLGPEEILPEGSVGSPTRILEAGLSGTMTTFATAEAGPNTITVAAAAPFLGLVAGDIISIAGASNAANNGTKTIVSVVTDGTVATVSETLVNEGPVATVSITSLPK